MYVPISNRLLEEVKDKINKMKETELRTVLAQNPVTQLSGLEEEVLKPIWKEHLHLKDQLPDKWTSKTKSFSVWLRVTLSDGSTSRYGVSVQTTHSIPLPPGMSPYSLAIEVDSKSPVFASYVAQGRQSLETTQRWNKVESQLETFLGKCKSLNEALKLWPQIDMYTPEEFLKKVNEKKKASLPSEAADALKELDTETITASAVIARMSTQ